jgi:transforming growth factor-beta-induced protein
LTLFAAVAAAPSLSLLGAAVVRAGLADTLNGAGNLGVFAPTNFAFSRLPAGLADTLFNNDAFIPHLANLLLYHVLDTVTPQQFQGNSIVTLNNERVLVSLVRRSRGNPPRTIFRSVNGNRVVGRNNIVASNGAATVSSGLLLPSWVGNSITDRVRADSDLSTLFVAVNLANLGGILAGAGALTLVAPSNSAFTALPPATFTFLTSTAGLATLTRILLYHVFPDILVSSELLNGLTTATLVAGKIVTVSVNGGKIVFNDAEVIQADILANNGVVHKINKVLTIPA